MHPALHTLLPLGEKGRDEGMSHPGDVPAHRSSVEAMSCTPMESARMLGVRRAQPLTPYPLSPKGRGE
jgi:hypothetical protein